MRYRYKIDFRLSFALCIIIMIFDQVWKFFENRPEAFIYGDIIYHAIAVISYIFTNLAIGIAAAIVFYFMAQYLDKNKNLESYADFRANTLELLYTHIEILHTEYMNEVKLFEELSESYGWGIKKESNVPILIKAFKNIHSEGQKSQFEENLKKYFSYRSYEELDDIMNEFEKYIDILNKKKDVNSFKGSKEIIERITRIFGEHFCLSYDSFKKIKLVDYDEYEEKNRYLNDMVWSYYSVLASTILLYEELEEFIDCIEKKRIIKFIKMVD